MTNQILKGNKKKTKLPNLSCVSSTFKGDVTLYFSVVPRLLCGITYRKVVTIITGTTKIRTHKSFNDSLRGFQSSSEDTRNIDNC